MHKMDSCFRRNDNVGFAAGSRSPIEYGTSFQRDGDGGRQFLEAPLLSSHKLCLAKIAIEGRVLNLEL